MKITGLGQAIILVITTLIYLFFIPIWKFLMTFGADLGRISASDQVSINPCYSSYMSPPLQSFPIGITIPLNTALYLHMLNCCYHQATALMP